MATQNPIEQEGTYPLPEAQVDRFMLKVKVGYPSRAEERVIMERMGGEELPRAVPVVSTEQIARARAVVHQVYVDDKVKDYIVEVVFATRQPEKHGLKDLAPLIEFGASPRASIALNLAARAAIQLGFMEARLAASGERIERIALSGDFIANSPGLAQFEHSLAGQRLDLMMLTAAVVRTYGDGSNFILGCGDLGNLASLIMKAS